MLHSRIWLPLMCAIFGLFVATPAAARSDKGEPYWTCGGTLRGDNFEGGYWQWFGEDGRASQLILQLYVGPQRRMVHWNMVNRFSSDSYMKQQIQFGGRPVDNAFRDGPSFVQVDFVFDRPAAGPLWAHYFGDGVFVGSEMLLTARDNRRHYQNRTAGLMGGLSNRDILSQLAPKRSWSVAVTDSTGRVVFRSDVAMPYFGDVERAFHVATADFDLLAADFRNRCAYDDGEVGI